MLGLEVSHNVLFIFPSASSGAQQFSKPSEEDDLEQTVQNDINGVNVGLHLILMVTFNGTSFISLFYYFPGVLSRHSVYIYRHKIVSKDYDDNFHKIKKRWF